MRIFLVLICSLALAFATVAQGAKKEDKSKKKKSAKTEQVSKPGKKAAGKPAAARKPARVTKPTGKPAVAGKPARAGKPTQAAKTKQAGKPAKADKPRKAGKATAATKPTGAGKPAKPGKAAKAEKRKGAAKTAGVARAGAKPFKPQRFNLRSKPKSQVAAVKFQQNRRIRGSDRWVGSNYRAFRNYRPEWRDRGWWRGNYSRVVFVLGGWYYWNANYWYPAWGYDPGAYYAYDGPIYAYNDLPPDQVIANVQAALQAQGYYHGEVDGLLGPLTRAAVADYQRDHGLYITEAIDRPTLESLGMA